MWFFLIFDHPLPTFRNFCPPPPNHPPPITCMAIMCCSLELRTCKKDWLFPQVHSGNLVGGLALQVSNLYYHEGGGGAGKHALWLWALEQMIGPFLVFTFYVKGLFSLTMFEMPPPPHRCGGNFARVGSRRLWKRGMTKILGWSLEMCSSSKFAARARLARTPARLAEKRDQGPYLQQFLVGHLCLGCNYKLARVVWRSKNCCHLLVASRTKKY